MGDDSILISVKNIGLPVCDKEMSEPYRSRLDLIVPPSLYSVPIIEQQRSIHNRALKEDIMINLG